MFVDFEWQLKLSLLGTIFAPVALCAILVFANFLFEAARRARTAPEAGMTPGGIRGVQGSRGNGVANE